MSEQALDPDELLRWAESYGHPEEWAKRAQGAHARAESAEARATSAEHSLSSARTEAQKLREALGRVANWDEQADYTLGYEGPQALARDALEKLAEEGTSE